LHTTRSIWSKGLSAGSLSTLDRARGIRRCDWGAVL